MQTLLVHIHCMPVCHALLASYQNHRSLVSLMSLQTDMSRAHAAVYTGHQLLRVQGSMLWWWVHIKSQQLTQPQEQWLLWRTGWISRVSVVLLCLLLPVEWYAASASYVYNISDDMLQESTELVLLLFCYRQLWHVVVEYRVEELLSKSRVFVCRLLHHSRSEKWKSCSTSFGLVAQQPCLHTLHRLGVVLQMLRQVCW